MNGANGVSTQPRDFRPSTLPAMAASRWPPFRRGGRKRRRGDLRTWQLARRRPRRRDDVFRIRKPLNPVSPYLSDRTTYEIHRRLTNFPTIHRPSNPSTKPTKIARKMFSKATCRSVYFELGTSRGCFPRSNFFRPRGTGLKKKVRSLNRFPSDLANTFSIISLSLVALTVYRRAGSTAAFLWT